MRYLCSLFTICIFGAIPFGCNRTQPSPSLPAAKGQVPPGIPAPLPLPGPAVKGTQQPVAPATTPPDSGGPLAYKVNAFKTLDSVKYSSGGIVLNVAPKEGLSILAVDLTVQNKSTQWEKYNSSWFQIVNGAGKTIDAKYMGFGANIYWSGSGSSSDSDGVAFLKFKGDIISNEWELAPAKSYTETYYFEIPVQTQGPRFEVVKR